MGLRLGKVLSVVSNVASSASKVNSAGNMSFLSSITGGVKSSGLDLLSANNILGSLTGIDVKKYLTIDNLGKVFNMDTDISSLIPNDLSVSNLMGDFNVDKIMSGIDMPSSIGDTNSLFGSKEADVTNEMTSAMSGVSSELTSLMDFGSVDAFSSVGSSISLF